MLLPQLSTVKIAFPSLATDYCREKELVTDQHCNIGSVLGVASFFSARYLLLSEGIKAPRGAPPYRFWHAR